MRFSRRLFLFGLLSCTLCGCKLFSNLNSDTVYALGKSIGGAAGLVCSAIDKDDKITSYTSSILNKLTKFIPIEDCTFAYTWNIPMQVELESLVDSGKLTEAQSNAIRSILNVAIEGVDYMFVKNPSWRLESDKLNSAILGFVDGFNSIICTNCVDKRSISIDIDVDTYLYLKTK